MGNQQQYNNITNYFSPYVKSKTLDNSQFKYTSLNYLINIHTNKTINPVYSQLTPSLMSYSYQKIGTTTNTTQLSNLNLSNLDVLSGTGLNFIYILTSNPQSYDTN